MSDKRGVDLRELRMALGLTQVEVAEKLGMNQPQYSMLERRADHRMSTVWRVFEGLGCTLHVSAKLPSGVVLYLGRGVGKSALALGPLKRATTPAPKQGRRRDRRARGRRK